MEKKLLVSNSMYSLRLCIIYPALQNLPFLWRNHFCDTCCFAITVNGLHEGIKVLEFSHGRSKDRNTSTMFLKYIDTVSTDTVSPRSTVYLVRPLQTDTVVKLYIVRTSINAPLLPEWFLT